MNSRNCESRHAARVPVMQPADSWNGDNSTASRRLALTRKGRIAFEREIGAIFVAKEAHDAAYIAAAQVHSIKNVLTFDARDFARYESLLRVWTPQAVLREWKTRK